MEGDTGNESEDTDLHFLKHRKAYIDKMHADEIDVERAWLFRQNIPPMRFNNTAIEGGYKAPDAAMQLLHMDIQNVIKKNRISIPIIHIR